ncbi:MAG: hypothetical protein EHM71_09655 [Zetaproteobacteria bacterium]|nr:MAG: hypothetical protein EHM71_09655 [Zetaproteobacteria bacterium]
MDTLLVALIGGFLLCGALLLRLSNQPRPCPRCGLRTEPLPDRIVDSRIPVVETPYWCPRCARVVSRRFLTSLWE